MGAKHFNHILSKKKMNGLLPKLRMVILALIFEFAASGCNVFHQTENYRPFPTVLISGPVKISNEWIEIVPVEPVKQQGMSNLVEVSCSSVRQLANKSDSSVASEDGTTLPLNNGQQTKLNAIIYDNQDQSYELAIGRIYDRGEFDLYVKPKTEMVNGKPQKVPSNFPYRGIFTKLRMRSEIPLYCEKIEWRTYDPK